MWYISLLFLFHNSSHKYILNSYRKITRFNEHSNLINPELGDQLRAVLSCWFSLRSWPKNIENLNVATLITIMSISDIMIKRIILITLTIVNFWRIKKRKDDHDRRGMVIIISSWLIHRRQRWCRHWGWRGEGGERGPWNQPSIRILKTI